MASWHSINMLTCYTIWERIPRYSKGYFFGTLPPIFRVSFVKFPGPKFPCWFLVVNPPLSTCKTRQTSHNTRHTTHSSIPYVRYCACPEKKKRNVLWLLISSSAEIQTKSLQRLTWPSLQHKSWIHCFLNENDPNKLKHGHISSCCKGRQSFSATQPSFPKWQP